MFAFFVSFEKFREKKNTAHEMNTPVYIADEIVYYVSYIDDSFSFSVFSFMDDDQRGGAHSNNSEILIVQNHRKFNSSFPLWSNRSELTIPNKSRMG